MPEAVIAPSLRSGRGRALKGPLPQARPHDLGAQVVDALLERNPDVDPATVEDLICGCGLPMGEQAHNLGRILVLLSDKLPVSVPGTTIHRYCASSLQAIRAASHAIRAGEADTYIAAGIECVSRVAPHSEAVVPETQNAKLDGKDGRIDAYISMGDTAENVADKYDVKREDMDAFAARSQQRAVESRDGGYFDREIVPVELPDGSIYDKDDGPRPGTTVEELAELKPVFREDGRVTAGNAWPLNDGAAATLLMSDTRANELGLKPRARIVASAVSALEPEIMGVGPIDAIGKVLDRAGMKIGDIDIVELNEAFAAQVLPVAEETGIDIDRQLNPHGGAIALGHPFGMTGARIMTTLLNGLETDDKQIGLETMCVGGGQGMAMIVERLN